MKKFNLLYILCLFAGLHSCSLDEFNPSGISTEQEWSTAAGYEKLVNGCYYDMIRIVYGQAEDTYVFVAEAGTDLWQDVNSSNGGWSQILRYDGFAASNSMIREPYSGFYGTLSACNAAIYYAGKVEGLTTDQINKLVAEAYFIRAHALFAIVEQWGGKYLPTEPMTSPQTNLPCSSINDFYNIILSDLEFAMTHLPVSHAVVGHVTKAAAYHLYAKAALTYSTYTDGLGGATPLNQTESRELLIKAQNAANYLISNASSLGVELYQNVAEVFDENNNKSNKEALFIVCHSMIKEYNPRGNYYNRVWKQFGAYANATTGVSLEGIVPSYNTIVNGVEVPKVSKCNCYMAPSKYLIDLYCENDGRYEAFFQDTYYVNNANNTDKTGYTWTSSDANRYGLDAGRIGNNSFDIPLGDTAIYIPRNTYTQAEKEATRYAIYNIEDNYKDITQPLKFFPSLKKADTPSLYAGTNASKPYSGADCIIYRLGETYLVAAEIAWRLGDNNTAADRLNVIRNRASKNNDSSLSISSSDVTEDFLLDEYAREMCGEWTRWFDLKRFRAFESRIKKANPQITSFNKDIHYLRPVPTAELLLLENADEYQNAGY